jgi:hypothetical protein
VRLLLAAYLALLALLAGFASIAGVIVFDRTGPSNRIEALADRHAYSVASWEMRSLPQKWLYKAAVFLKGRPQQDDDAVLRRYFEVAGQLQDAESRSAGADARDALSERSRLENRVEDILEGRITQVLKDQGLALRPPIFGDMGLVFPPVDFEFDSPPRVLAVSPRARIELAASYLLTPGISPDTALAIEREAEAAAVPGYPGGASVLVVSTGGVATYPSVVPELESYDSLVPTVIHEWVHQYLAFFPLGASYFAGSATRTINESAADLAGRALAEAYFQRYGRLDSPAPASAAQPGDGFDFGKEMRALRVRVEELLASGDIGQAEQLMEAKREEFARHGVFIRRLNQAYFAFHGSYADTPASIDPIGPKLETLLQRAGSPGQFLRLVAGVTSERELDALVARTAG